MPRVPLITGREHVAAEYYPQFDAVAESRGRVGGPFAALMHSPEVSARTAHLGAYLRFDSILPGALREVTILASAREANCPYEFSGHATLARREGVSEEVIRALADRSAPAGLPPELAVPVAYVLELARTRKVSATTFQAALDMLGLQALTELTAILGYYTMLAFTLNAFEVTPAPEAERYWSDEDQ